MLIGNLTRDPEIRYTPKGTAVTELGLAVNRSWVVDGERREEVTFVDVTIWGKQAESAGQWLAKGRPVFVEGRLQADEWDDKETGKRRSKLKVVAESWQFVGPKESGGGSQGSPSSAGGYEKRGASETPVASGPKQPAGISGQEDEDIPF